MSQDTPSQAVSGSGSIPWPAVLLAPRVLLASRVSSTEDSDSDSDSEEMGSSRLQQEVPTEGQGGRGRGRGVTVVVLHQVHVVAGIGVDGRGHLGLLPVLLVDPGQGGGRQVGVGGRETYKCMVVVGLMLQDRSFTSTSV